MKLSQILFRRNYMPNGNIFRGKDRLVKRVEPRHLRKLQQDFATEEQNMFYLRFPYLSEAAPFECTPTVSYSYSMPTAESSGHTKALGKAEKKMEAIKEYRAKIFKEDVTLYERFRHLRVSESWD